MPFVVARQAKSTCRANGANVKITGKIYQGPRSGLQLQPCLAIKLIIVFMPVLFSGALQGTLHRAYEESAASGKPGFCPVAETAPVSQKIGLDVA